MFNRDTVSTEVKFLGNTTLVKFYNINGKVVGMGIAKCNPTDSFDKSIGEVIATFKAEQDFEYREFLKTIGAW